MAFEKVSRVFAPSVGASDRLWRTHSLTYPEKINKKARRGTSH